MVLDEVAKVCDLRDATRTYSFVKLYTGSSYSLKSTSESLVVFLVGGNSDEDVFHVTGNPIGALQNVTHASSEVFRGRADAKWPNGKRLKQKRPKGVVKVAVNLLLSDSGICRKPAKIGCHSRSTDLFSSV